eukprot:TRINITY_DN18234_c0_g1_i1.p1 TRINITY_DN18234_c0_g1~~TRINITY_DN18234_c0_g1_i1.p1  ORF type:complete len:248 (-),score=30.79 TRINITY_DN18234_c0_g1_i1:134-877(-)
MADDLPRCEKADLQLEHWTFVRFLVMGLIMLYRAYQIRQNGLSQKQPPEEMPYKAHPDLTKRLKDVDGDGSTIGGFILSLLVAAMIFVQSEGVGFVVYFATSFTMDNYMIFFAEHVEICEYIMQVVLYSGGCVTFLPCVLVSYLFQGRLYDQGAWLGTKPLFIFLMVASAAGSFFLRLFLIYRCGYDDFVDRLLKHNHFKVLIAILVPPIVDAVQTLMLIGASMVTKGLDETQRASYEIAPDTPESA